MRNTIRYSDLMNKQRFEVRLPEYYNPALPDYYRKPTRQYPPMLNGQPVTVDEYVAATGLPVPVDTFIPTVIYEPMDYNEIVAMKTPAEIIELLNDSVPFKIIAPKAIETIADIMAGYIAEITPFVTQQDSVAKYLGIVRIARVALLQGLSEVQRLHPNYREKATTISDIFKSLKGA